MFKVFFYKRRNCITVEKMDDCRYAIGIFGADRSMFEDHAGEPMHPRGATLHLIDNPDRHAYPLGYDDADVQVIVPATEELDTLILGLPQHFVQLADAL